MARRSVVGRVAVIVTAALLAGMLAYLLTAPARVTDRDAAHALLASPVTSEPLPSPGPGIPTRSAAPRTAPAQPPPTRISIPALAARMRVAATGLDATGRMAIPENPRVAGWYRFGPAPGDDAGAVVLAAHVDNEGSLGPLARLSSLDPGDRIIVTAGSRTISYRVVRVDRYDKQALDLTALFEREGPPRLHLITCGGAFDRASGHYEDNVVAVATRVSG